MVEKIKIKKIEQEGTEEGVALLRVSLRKGNTVYVRGVAAGDYLDDEHPEKRKSVERHWKKDIEKIERLKGLSKKEIGDKIKGIEGTELTDE